MKISVLGLLAHRANIVHTCVLFEQAQLVFNLSFFPVARWELDVLVGVVRWHGHYRLVIIPTLQIQIGLTWILVLRELEFGH